MMNYRFEYRRYERQFVRSLSTSHGRWDVREGIILRLTDETGQVGWGEIAPLPWFGSETLESALDFCCQLGDEITTATIDTIPDALPACHFGFESAWEDFDPQPGALKRYYLPDERRYPSDLSYSSLLPAGEAALQAWETLWKQGYRTFKWKIGVAPIQDELKLFDKLIQALPPGVKLRLDANCGLNWQQAKEWLLQSDSAGVEFLEQPLPVHQFDSLLELSAQYSTPIALDESVATLAQLQSCYQNGWRGIFVIKPCIAGSLNLLRQFCQKHPIDAVFSSVFETAIGRQAALKLAAELSHPNRAVGFGVNHWFAENEETWLEHLWKNH
jgi:O-succinylbenzoate synthase